MKETSVWRGWVIVGLLEKKILENFGKKIFWTDTLFQFSQRTVTYLYMLYERRVRVYGFNRKKVWWKFKRFQLFSCYLFLSALLAQPLPLGLFLLHSLLPLTGWEEECVVILLLVKGIVGYSLLKVFPQRYYWNKKNKRERKRKEKKKIVEEKRKEKENEWDE